MLGLVFSCQEPKFEEQMSQVSSSNTPYQLPRHFAEQKALSLSVDSDNLILGYDTVVVLQGRLLGKPGSHQEALTMIQDLAGNTHSVYTGVALARGGTLVNSGYEETKVTFAQCSPQALKAYAWSEEPMDKAGAYAIQGMGSFLVSRINGCFYNVMGAPIQMTLGFLKPFFN